MLPLSSSSSSSSSFLWRGGCHCLMRSNGRQSLRAFGRLQSHYFRPSSHLGLKHFSQKTENGRRPSSSSSSSSSLSSSSSSSCSHATQSWICEEKGDGSPSFVFWGDGKNSFEKSKLNSPSTPIPSSSSSFFHKTFKWIRRSLLPQDYPHSVTTDYLSFHQWAAIQNLLQSASYALATHSLLTAAGVTAGGVPAAIGVTWVLKDGLGCLGTLFCAGKFGSKVDQDPKFYKLRADTVASAGVILETLTPLFPGLFLGLASIASVMKSTAALVSGSTRMALIEGFAKHQNLGDLVAKLHSQSTTSFFVGICLGIPLSLFCEEDVMLRFAFVTLLSGGSIISSYQSLKAVQIRSLNFQKASILLDHVVSTGTDFLSPLEVSKRENFLFPQCLLKKNGIEYGATFSQLKEKGIDLNSEQFWAIVNVFSQESYILYSVDEKIYVILRNGHNKSDHLKSIYSALLLKQKFGSQNLEVKELTQISHESNALFGSIENRLKLTGWSSDFDLIATPSHLKSCDWNINKNDFSSSEK